MGQTGLTEQGLFAYSMYLECPGADRARTLLGIQCKWGALGQTGRTGHTSVWRFSARRVPWGGQGTQYNLHGVHRERPGTDRAHSATYMECTRSALGRTGHAEQLTWNALGVPRGRQGMLCNLNGVHQDQECLGADRAHSATYMECTRSALGRAGHAAQLTWTAP